ncbi:MAG: SDR family oxidoreductase [Promethearchaeota archaeon]|jgi:NAD(P)-dependent dehydrogenase (short-subunit alcohol dehydrogenase family)
MGMEGKVCIITGANSGIGKATAISLAKLNATVIMLCREKGTGEIAHKKIISETGNRDVDLLICDLSSQEQIRKFVDEFKQKYHKLHILINNAGIMASKRKISPEGFEMNFAVNFLAPFLLTNLLLDYLKKSVPSRIINVSSAAHRMGKLDFDDLQYKNRKYSLHKVYGASKLALMLFSYELSRRLEGTGVTVNTLHPGVVNTNLGREMSKFSQGFGKLFFKSPEKGAETSIYLATSPDVEGITGKYYIKKQQKESSNDSYNEGLATRLWDISSKMTQLEPN